MYWESEKDEKHHQHPYHHCHHYHYCIPISQLHRNHHFQKKTYQAAGSRSLGKLRSQDSLSNQRLQDCQIVKLAPAMIVKLSNQRLRIFNVFIIVVLFSRHFCTDADVLIFAIIILFHPYAIVRGDICHSRHCQRQCKVFASGVNF